MATYQELLLREEWLYYRKEIIKRDDRRCINCQNETYLANFESSLGKVKINLYKDTVVIIDRFGESGKLNDSSIEEGKYYCYFSRKEGSGRATIQAIRHITDNDIYISKLESQKKLIDGFELLGDIIYYPSKKEIKSYYLKNKKLNLSDVPPQSPTAEFQWLLVKNLHVHHTYYQYDLYPWQYPTDSLQTLCWSCHEKLHANGKVPVYDSKGVIINDTFLTACERCHGAGWFPEYINVELGICFKCHGAKYEELIGK